MSKRKASNSNKPSHKLLQIIVFLVFLSFVGAYLFWDYDPLHLFTPTPTPTPEATPTPEVRVVPTPTPGATTAPVTVDWWQVYFTEPKIIPVPQNPATDVPAGSIEEELIRRFNQAQKSIHIAAFEFDLTPMAEALIAAHKRGVDVKWVTDDEHGLEADEERGHGQFKLLQDAGIPVKDDGRTALMHNKFIVFDSAIPERATVWTGATNLTLSGIFKNNNNAIAIRSPELAAIYEREFDEMWNGQFGPRSPSTVDQQTVTINGAKIQALFASEDKVIEKLVPLVNQAQRSIRVMAFVLMNDSLGQAILARAQAGLNVAGIIETLQSETQYSELPPLYCAGVPMKQDTNPTMFHHKVIVIDEQITITGSLNFSDSADKSNDENVLVIWNPDIAAAYLHEFDRRWIESKDPDPTKMKCPDVPPTAIQPIAGQPVRLQTAPPVPSVTPTPLATMPPVTLQPATAPPVATECLIKGNIDSRGSKLYYLPGDSGYGSVKIDAAQGERMFCSEQEAIAAGWQRKN